jgi:hypothetical protein
LIIIILGLISTNEWVHGFWGWAYLKNMISRSIHFLKMTIAFFLVNK